MRFFPLAAIAAACSIPAITAYGDEKAVGAVGGAAFGAVVGGPVGIVVGAGIGALIGSTLSSEPSVVSERSVVVGEALPDSYIYHEVPDYPDYQYALLNNQRILVDRRWHRVLRVIE